MRSKKHPDRYLAMLERFEARLNFLRFAFERRSLLSLELVVIVLFWPVIVLFLIAMEGILWQHLTFALSIPIFVLLSLTFLGAASIPGLLRQNVQEELDQRGSGGSFILLGPIMYYYSFVLLSRGAWLIKGQAAFSIAPDSPTMTRWVLYGFDNLLRVFLFDFPETFGLSLSGIEHVQSFWMSLLVFSFRFTLSIAALKVVLGGLKIIAAERARTAFNDPFGLI